MKRGYFGIGIENNIKEHNLGTLWRSAHAFGATFVFTVGRRYEHQHSDVQHVTRHMPLFAFDTLMDMRKQCPNVAIFGIEFLQADMNLHSFSHPERAIYLLGSEGRGLSHDAIAMCDHVISIPTILCLNVASAGTVVLYDRQHKRRREA